MKLTNNVCIMGFPQKHYGLWKTEDELDKVCQEMSNRGFTGIRYVPAGFYGSQDNNSPYCDDWMFPFQRVNGKVDFSQANDKFEERMHLLFRKQKKYGLVPRIDLFDGCGATMGYDPFQAAYNVNGVTAIWSGAALPYIKKYIKRLVAVAKQYYDINDIKWGDGNELYAYPVVTINGTKYAWSPSDCAKWQKTIADYLVSLGVNRKIVVSGHEKKRDIVTKLTTEIKTTFDYDKVYDLSDEGKKVLKANKPITLGAAKELISTADFNALSKFLGASIVEWLQVWFCKWKEGTVEKGWGEEEWLGNMYFAYHEYDDTEMFDKGQILDRFTTNNGSVVKADLLAKAEISTDGSGKTCKKHQAGWPVKPGYGMGTDEEILALYKHMITTCENMGVKELIFDFLENGWIKTDDGVNYYLDWTGYDWLAVEMIMDHYKAKYKKESGNRGKYPEQIKDEEDEDTGTGAGTDVGSETEINTGETSEEKAMSKKVKLIQGVFNWHIKGWWKTSSVLDKVGVFWLAALHLFFITMLLIWII